MWFLPSVFRLHTIRQLENPKSRNRRTVCLLLMNWLLQLGVWEVLQLLHPQAVDPEPVQSFHVRRPGDQGRAEAMPRLSSWRASHSVPGFFVLSRPSGTGGGPHTLQLPRQLSGKAAACQSVQETQFDPWVGKIPWRGKWQPTPVFLPGRSHGHRSLAVCGITKELDTT